MRTPPPHPKALRHNEKSTTAFCHSILAFGTAMAARLFFACQRSFRCEPSLRLSPLAFHPVAGRSHLPDGRHSNFVLRVTPVLRVESAPRS
nr:MAG TPA: hypothetical protein [Caudoviricetes sp.]